MRIYNQIADADIVIKAREGEVPEHVEDTEVARGSSLL